MPAIQSLVLVMSLTLVGKAPSQFTPDYFPTTVGAKWFYKIDDWKFTQVVTAVEEKDNKKIVSVGKEYTGRINPVFKMTVSKEGLYRVTASKTNIYPPKCMLKLPYEKGTKWIQKGTFPAKEETVYEIVGQESVEVPAGKYMAIKVKSDDNSLWWYAPNVGLVKGTTTEANGKTRVQILMKFESGKEEEKK